MRELRVLAASANEAHDEVVHRGSPSSVSNGSLEHAYTRMSPAPACNEDIEYRRSCSSFHDDLANDLRQWRGKRGLYLEFVGQSGVGLGHAVANAFLLHDICRQLQRYCYIKIYDMDLHLLMGYAAGGLSWGPPDETEQAQYSKSDSVTLSAKRDGIGNLLGKFGLDGIKQLGKRAFANRSFIHVRTQQNLRHSGGIFLPVFPGENQERAHPRLTRCFCRFVTQPILLGLEGRNAMAKPAAITYQLRTGYADLDDRVLHSLARHLGIVKKQSTHERDARDTSLAEDLGTSYHEMARWLALACPRAKKQELRSVRVLSDSPPLSAHLAGLSLGAGLLTTRSWAAPLEAKQRAWADMIAGSLSDVFYAGQSSFGRPLVARSVCIKDVRALTDKTSLCPRFNAIFHRGFFDLLQFRTSKYNRTREELPADHPCKAVVVPRICAAQFVASVSGASLLASRNVLDARAGLRSTYRVLKYKP